MHLTGRQKRHLRALAHDLDPVVIVGQDGVSPAIEEELDRSLEAHELLKIRLSGDREERRRQAHELARTVGAAVAGIVGSVAILYRPHPDPDGRTIELP